MKLSKALWICGACLAVGIAYYALQTGLVIIQVPSYGIDRSNNEYVGTTQKNIMLYYWSQGSFKHEATTVIDSDNKADTLRYIVTSWLTVFEQSGCLAKKIGLETVMLSSSESDVYISFERTIFAKNEPTFDKWMCAEALLKTIHDARVGINRVHFFVHHQPLVDAHLDFSQAWPIHGFMDH